MEAQFGPNAVDEPKLLYKLQHKIKIFNTSNTLSSRGYNLVASSSKYGLVFIGSPEGTLLVYSLKELIDKECNARYLSVKLQEKPTHIAVNCDQELLAVTGGQFLNVYKVINFQNEHVSPSVSMKCEVNSTTFVSALQWNPCVPDTIAIAFYDGTLIVSQVNNVQMKKVQSKARCICWSPKGKQLVVGNSDGTLCQYKPDLSPMKTVPIPKLFEGAPVEAMAVYWISTYQFAVVYKNATDNSRPVVTIVNTPKGAQPSCLNYEDICYSMGSNRPWYYYLLGIAQWNLILCSSSNSMEIATLGSTDGANWLQWCQTDEARPELPLTDKKQENYPVGVCIDTCAIHQLPWGENETLPFMPLLHVVSQSGLLTIFNIINFNQDAAQICTPPQQLTLPAAALRSDVPDGASTNPIPTPTPMAQPQAEPVQSAPQPVVMFSTPISPASGPMTTPQISQFGLPAPNIAAVTKPFSLSQVNQESIIASPGLSTPQKQDQFKNNISSTQYQAVQAPRPLMPQISKPQMVSQPSLQSTATIPRTTPVTMQTTTVIAQSTTTTKQTASATPVQTPEANAAIKAEQERLNKIKVNNEMKNMLIKEVNDFQMELYNFILKSNVVQNKIQHELQSLDSNANLQTIDLKKLKKEFSLEEIRAITIQLKLELVRTCAAFAEARTQAELKDFPPWTHADPLTSKRVASVKKLSYYIQTQLDQAHRALDHQWNEMISRDPQFNKPGQRMIRPILDDVYQPLVRQQEIISRQQATLKALRNMLNQCEVTPVFKSTSLLRSTPFKNKDPLSKLTKNILNMSIEPQNKSKVQLSPQKLDALKDVLSNRATVKIKPTSYDVTQHLENMKFNYEKSLERRELEKNEKKMLEQFPVKVTVQKESIGDVQSVQIQDKISDVKHETTTIPTLIPSNNKVETSRSFGVSKALFSEQPKEVTEIKSVENQHIPKQPPQRVAPAFGSSSFGQIQTAGQKPSTPQNIPQSKSQPFGFATPTSITASATTRSVLKDLLQSKQASAEAKSDSNTFMGQKICSPTSLNATSAPLVTNTSTTFTAKPISDLNNMFNKFTPQAFISETKSQVNTTIPKSSETGEPVALTVFNKPTENKKEDKTMTTKTGQALNFSKMTTSSDSKGAESSKENVPQKVEESIVKTVQKDDKKETATVPLTAQITNKSPFTFVSDAQNDETKDASPKIKTQTENNTDLPTKSNTEVKTTKSSETVSAASLFASANAAITNVSNPSPFSTTSTSSSSIFETALKPSASPLGSESKFVFGTKTSTASSIFSAANASQPSSLFSAITKTTQAESSPSTAATPITNSFGTTDQSRSIFATGTTTSITQSSVSDTVTTQSIFSSTVSKPSVSNTPNSQSPSSVFASKTSTSQVSESSVATTADSISSAVATSTQGAISAPAATSQSLFGSPPATTQNVFSSEITTASSVFSGPTAVTATQSVFNSTTTQSIFSSAATTTAPSIFSTPATTSVPSIFGNTNVTTAPIIFGSTATTTNQSVFSSTLTTTAQTVFGSKPAETTQNVFGVTATTAQSIFGSGASPTKPAFGTPATTAQSFFGTSTTDSIFAVAVTTASNIFGSSASPRSVFGSPTATTQSSVFNAPTTTQSSIFGVSSPTTQVSVFGAATQASIFGTPTPPTQSSVFGAQTTQTSLFGTTTTSTAQTSGSLFGSDASNLFAAASISTTSAPSETSTGNVFGGSSSGSVFGSNSGTNVFGGKASFGQPNPQTSAIFGGGASFGQKPASNFWGANGNTSGTGFGSSGFGQQATTQSSSIFGGGTGGSFSSPSPGGAFGSPQQQASSFGSPQQQTTPAFGGSPGFGSKPIFGQSASFGSPSGGGFSSFGGFNKSPGGVFGAPASFGGGAAFGAPAFGNNSPGKMFGNSSPGFASSAQSNATFESLATQSTLTFGNLAQQSAQQSPSAPTFNTSPSFTGWRG